MIFVALALVWAVALLPKALRQHDEVAQTRSVDRVSDSMRVLARREVVSEREARLVITPPRAAVPAQRELVADVVSPAPTRTPVSRSRVKARIAAQRKAAAAAARRRRSILVVLVAVGIGVGVAAGLGRLPLWTIAIPGVVVVGFLVLARVLVRKVAPMGDPIQIQVRGYELTLRREDAARIEVRL